MYNISIYHLPMRNSQQYISYIYIVFILKSQLEKCIRNND